MSMRKEELSLLIEVATRRLSVAGIKGASSEVARIFSHCVTYCEIDELTFADYLDARERRVPIGHVLGKEWFDGLEFVSPIGTFVPREQSVPMIEDICARLEGRPVARVLDLCAGVGTLGISIVNRLPCPSLDLIEHNEHALDALAKNCESLVPKGCVARPLKVDIFSESAAHSCNGDATIVVANPPFVPEGQASMPEFSIHHPHDAIFSGTDGFSAVERCCFLARTALQSGGVLGVEHHESHVSRVCGVLFELGFNEIRQFADGDGKKRVTTAVFGVDKNGVEAELASARWKQ